jgi:phosphatidylserine/phosphatidylglycerophosphate/cardiolipin synthase-like enzyme
MRLGKGSAVLASVVTLASTISFVGVAAAAPLADTSVSSSAVSQAVVGAGDSGEPPEFNTIRPGNYFSYLNRSRSASLAIRNRVLHTVKSTWGQYTAVPDDPATTGVDETVKKRGMIRMVTWSFGDRGMTDALIAARRRGVVVQIVAAGSINNDGGHSNWPRIRRALNGQGNSSWARECRGACRGSGGAAHSKYFLFQDVGSRHQRDVVVQTSMNLTTFAWQGQWNQATVMWDADIYQDFNKIFLQSASGGRTGRGYHSHTSGNITDIFFPIGRASRDPILRALNRVRCKTPTSGGVGGRTRVRAINYAIYQTRGVAIAKKFRRLWNAGCNVRIIYSLTSRPVLKILRSRSGRGPVPMRQTVIKNGRGVIVKYNHSKWLAISGHYYGVSRGAWTVIPGSANWSNLSYSSDEQMQQIFGSHSTAPYFRAFDTTWNQRTSRPPANGRVAGGTTLSQELARIPQEPTFGKGIYKYMTEGG